VNYGRDLPLSLARAEALFWLLKPHRLSSPVLIGAAGFAAAGGTAAESAVFAVFVWCQTAAIMALNDVFDAEKDQETNPEAPIAAGMISRLSATLVVLAVSLFGAGVLYALQRNIFDVGIAMAITVTSVLIAAAYSAFKGSGALGSVLAGLPFAGAALIGLLLGDDSPPAWTFAVLITYGLVRGFATNVCVALRDVDSDPSVGNMTLPVRIGARRGFLVTASISLVLALTIATVSILGEAYASFCLAVAGLAIFAASSPRVLEMLKAEGLGRKERMKALRRYDQERLFIDGALYVLAGSPAGLLLVLALEAAWIIGTAVVPGRQARVKSRLALTSIEGAQ
jgi:4-hydroxybenzoate polyprenyltransferase